MEAMDEQDLDMEALEGLTNPAEVEAVAGTLDKLTKDTELLVFIAAGCPACPHQVRSVATLALASPRVSVEIVDANESCPVDPINGLNVERADMPSTHKANA